MSTTFISYAQADAPAARQIATLLAKRGVKVLSADSIPAGANVSQSIYDMLMDADGFVFLVSKEFARSDWANVEVAAAVGGASSGRPKPIVPVLLGDVDPDKDLPQLLRRYRWLDFRTGFSPDQMAQLAASLRARPGETTGTQLESEAELLKLRYLQLERERIEHLQQDAEMRRLQVARLFNGMLAAVALSTVLLILSVAVRGEGSTLLPGFAGALLGSAVTFLFVRRSHRSGRRLSTSHKEHGNE